MRAFEKFAGGLRSPQPICGQDKSPELAPVVARGPVVLATYSSYAASKNAGSVRLSKVVIPGLTLKLRSFVRHGVKKRRI